MGYKALNIIRISFMNKNRRYGWLLRAFAAGIGIKGLGNSYSNIGSLLLSV